MFGLKTKEEKTEAELQRQKVVRFKKVFGTPDGKEVLKDFMNDYHFLNSHDGNRFKEGQRSVVLDVLVLCNLKESEILEMFKGEE